MTDPRHEQDLAELAALYALEALGDDAQRQFTRSLETASASTKEEVAAFQEVVQELAFSGPAIAPPASLKAKLMARIAQEPQEQEGAGDFTFVRSAQMAWRDLGPGVSMKMLFNDSAGDAGYDVVAAGSGWRTGGTSSQTGRRVLRAGRELHLRRGISPGGGLPSCRGRECPSHHIERRGLPGPGDDLDTERTGRVIPSLLLPSP
jgi:hypothetical protein